MPKKTLVVVTCKKDLDAFQILANSIDRYLIDSKIIVVWNETDDVKILQDIITSYKFSAEILVKKDFWNSSAENHLTPMEYDGWIDQQVIKLCVSHYVDTQEYVVLDSKNFFIDYCSLDDVKPVYPQEINWCEPILKNFILECCKLFNIPPVKKLVQNTTPYIVNTKMARKLIDHFGSMEELFIWFSSTARKEHISPAEFFLYEIFTISKGKANPGEVFSNQNTLWEHHYTEYKMNCRSMIREIQLGQKLHKLYVSGTHNGLKKYINVSPIHKHFRII